MKSAVFFIYKGKGEQADPNNYRTICIQDPFAKVFSSILTKRLADFSEQNHLLPKYQFGFRPKRSTVAAAGLLHEIVKSHQAKKQRTYAAYVDFQKAFDRVQRPLLFHKLTILGIPTHFCLILEHIFQMTKYVIKTNNSYSENYTSNVGVPQGDPIFPILFNLFISDLPSHLGHTGITLNNLRVPYIQYADDLCILGETPEDLQRGLDGLANYCAADQCFKDEDSDLPQGTTP